MELLVERGRGSLRVRSLASGSNGNCVVIQSGDAAVLIDAGISGRAVLAGLAETGIPESAVRAVLLTHEHSDHTRGLSVVARRLGAAVVANRATLAAAGACSRRNHVLETGGTLDLAGFRVRSFAVSHDAVETVGYVVEGEDRRVVCCTDAGVPGELGEHLHGADLAILEANHDVDRLMAGPYPEALKRRILGEAGHLSNTAAAELVCSLLERRPGAEVWLAHLSAVNNTPQLALSTVRRCVAQGGHDAGRVTVAPRGRPGPIWDSAGRWQQLSLF